MAFCFCTEAGGRDMSPAVHLLFFAPPKKRRQKKGGPTCRVPALRSGQPVVLDRGAGHPGGAVPSNSLCSLRSRRSNNAGKSEVEARASCRALARPSLCAPRHVKRGWEPWLGPSLRSALASSGPRFAWPVLASPGTAKLQLGIGGIRTRCDDREHPLPVRLRGDDDHELPCFCTG